MAASGDDEVRTSTDVLANYQRNVTQVIVTSLTKAIPELADRINVNGHRATHRRTGGHSILIGYSELLASSRSLWTLAGTASVCVEASALLITGTRKT